VIGQYVQEFDRWLVGDVPDRIARHAELVAHLESAEEAGEFDAARARLGSPRAAASSFGPGPALTSAALSTRAIAAVIDNAPYIIASVAMIVIDVLRFMHSRHNLSFGFPAAITWYGDRSLVENLLVPLGLAWSIFAVAAIEAWRGRSPGKALLGLRTISEDGTAVSFRQALIRRLSLLFGPFVWIDVAVAFGTARRQRGFDLLARTRVVRETS